MEKMLTPEEYIQNRYDLNSEQLDGWREQMVHLKGFNFDNIPDLMDAYANYKSKYYVQQALEAAAEKAETERGYQNNLPVVRVVKQSILNAYPLDNIK